MYCMETLRLMLETMNHEHTESQHAEFDHVAYDLVARLAGDYGIHRERIQSFEATNQQSRAGVGGNPQPSGVTPLMSRCNPGETLHGDDCR